MSYTVKETEKKRKVNKLITIYNASQYLTVIGRRIMSPSHTSLFLKMIGIGSHIIIAFIIIGFLCWGF